MKKSIIGLLVVCLFLCVTSVMAEEWQVPGDFATIQAAINASAVVAGDTIKVVGPGSFYGATVTKQVEIKGENGAVINDGPSPWNMATRRTGFYFPQNGGVGSTISHLTFESVEFPVFSRGVDDVTVEHCTMKKPVQGVTNWHGVRWQVAYNEIIDLRTLNGGGIGILVGSRLGLDITDNLVAHNKINGTVYMGAGELGGYNATGIVLFADFRWGAAGASSIAYNQVVKNKIALKSEKPSLVDVVAVELTDTRDDPDLLIICDNSIGFNDFRGTTLQLQLTPEELATCNAISRNFGENRGHGLHPSAF